MVSICQSCGAEILDIDVRCGSCGMQLSSTGAQRLLGSVVLDQYEIVDVIGQGGMSVVYKAKHQLTGQLAALKVLPPELAAYSQMKSRFLDEARALAQLDHPNIVHLYNFGEDQGCFVLAMQYVEGQTWERLIVGGGRLPWQRSVQIAIDVLGALEYAHARGVIHRDMKSSNVLVREHDGTATVMDFGIAKMQTSTRLTATGQTMGTVRYMSPEQVRGKEVDHRTDVYSTAVTLFESVTGETPFDGDTHFEIMTQHLKSLPPRLRTLEPSAPEALERIIAWGLQKRTDDRPSSVAELRDALAGLLAGEAVVTPVPQLPVGATESGPAELGPELDPSPARGSLLWLAVVGGLLVLAGAGATAYYFFGLDDGTKKRATLPPSTADASRVTAPVTGPHLIPGLALGEPVLLNRESVEVRATGDGDPSARVVGQRAAAEARVAPKLEAAGFDVPERAAGKWHVMVVEDPKVFCDVRLYEEASLRKGCETRDGYFRAEERTLYVRGVALADDRRLEAVFDVAAGIDLCYRSKALVDIKDIQACIELAGD